MFSVEFVHKFYSIKIKWYNIFNIQGKNIKFKLDSRV